MHSNVVLIKCRGIPKKRQDNFPCSAAGRTIEFRIISTLFVECLHSSFDSNLASVNLQNHCKVCVWPILSEDFGITVLLLFSDGHVGRFLQFLNIIRSTFGVISTYTLITRRTIAKPMVFLLEVLAHLRQRAWIQLFKSCNVPRAGSYCWAKSQSYAGRPNRRMIKKAPTNSKLFELSVYSNPNPFIRTQFRTWNGGAGSATKWEHHNFCWARMKIILLEMSRRVIENKTTAMFIFYENYLTSYYSPIYGR